MVFRPARRFTGERRLPVVDAAQDSKVKTILSELRDVNKDRRRTAVMKLGMVGGEQALRTLIAIVNNSQEDLIVRGRAALMLGKLKDDRAVPHLIRALEAPGFLTPYHAAQALGQDWRSPRGRRFAGLR